MWFVASRTFVKHYQQLSETYNFCYNSINVLDTAHHLGWLQHCTSKTGPVSPSAMIWMKSSVFWAVTQHWKAAGSQYFWNSYWSHLHNLNDQRQHKQKFPKCQHQTIFQCYISAQKPKDFLNLSPSNGDLTQQGLSERVGLSHWTQTTHTLMTM